MCEVPEKKRDNIEDRAEMNRWYLPDVFVVPQEYIIPEGEELLVDTNHPETNSLGFTYKVSKYNRPSDMPVFYSSIAQNREGQFILAANNFNTCVFDGVIAAVDDFGDYVSDKLDSAKFKVYLKENIHHLEWLEGSLFVATTSNNTVDVFNTKEQPLTEGNVLKRVGRGASDGVVTRLAQLNEGGRFVVGTTRGTIEGFDYSTGEMQHLFAFAGAHTAEITGMSTHPKLQSQWVSCSAASCMLWDKRQVYPCIKFADKRNVCYAMTDVKWYSENYMIITDSSGEYMVFDCRKSNDVFFQMTLNDDIERLVLSGNRLGIISRCSEKTKLYEIDRNQEPILQHTHISPEPVYSMCWDCTGAKTTTCYIVGENKYAKEIDVKSK